jgi:hypothetical protein
LSRPLQRLSRLLSHLLFHRLLLFLSNQHPHQYRNHQWNQHQSQLHYLPQIQFQLNPALCLNLSLNLNLLQYLNQLPLQTKNPLLNLTLSRLNYPQTLSQNP